MRFDAFVRRLDRTFPNSKKVFAHPFVSNPEAQLLKHNFNKEAGSFSFNQQTVGKIFIHFNNNSFNLFSPNAKCPSVPLPIDIAKEVLLNKGTMLIYIAKSKIYDGTYKAQFGKYIEICPKLKDGKALQIIKTLKNFIGAKEEGSDKHSNLIELMERGVVTHHGSMPLKARLIVEQFIKEGLARICFATSTLNQGINMPFDVVWVDNFRNVKDLTLKNLIGRAGRTTCKLNNFDYGYTIIKTENLASFSKRYKSVYKLTSTSRLDDNPELVDEDMQDIVDAIKSDGFNDELYLPSIQVERIRQSKLKDNIEFILNNLFREGKPITGSDYYDIPKDSRDKLKECFKLIYVKHLRRRKLEPGESSVLSAAIPIMLWHIQGRSFSEIVSLRHSFLTDKSGQGRIKALLRNGEISHKQADELWRRLYIRFSQIPSTLPNKKQARKSNFPYPGAHIDTLDYDSLVYDTYDYLDKVISLSLVDPICAALIVYYESFNDYRAKALANYIRYGTNDDIEIWLLKYGFEFDDIEWIKEHVEHIDQNRIVFKDSISVLADDKKEIISRFI